MSSKSPYVTLAAAAGLFATLIIVNMAQAPDRDAKPSEYGDAPSSSEPVEPEESEAEETEPPEPEETEEAEPDEPDAPAFPAEAVYAGRTNRNGPAIAIAVLDGQAAAYFCDGASIEAWLTGTADDGEFELEGKGDAEVKGDLIKGRLVGSVEVGDREYGFSISASSPPAGLYRADGQGAATIGWIVLPDGSQVGIASIGGERAPAPELEPGSSVEVDGQSFEPEPVAGDAAF